MKKAIFVGFAIDALLIGWLITLSCVGLESEPSTNASIIVGVLGVLVTALVGFQVWQTIYAKETIKSIKEKVDNAIKDINDKILSLNTKFESDQSQRVNLHNATMPIVQAMHFDPVVNTKSYASAYVHYLLALSFIIQIRKEIAGDVSYFLGKLYKCIDGALRSNEEMEQGDFQKCEAAYRKLMALQDLLTNEEIDLINALHLKRSTIKIKTDSKDENPANYAI